MDGVASAGSIVPEVLRSRRVKLPHERKQGAEPLVVMDALQDRLACDVVVGANAVNGQNAKFRLHFCGNPH
jgi:hypothetical protein